jgi:hypothetical protein
MRKQERWRKAYLRIYLDQITTMEKDQAHSPEPTKARRWQARPATVRPHPWCTRTPSAASRARLTLAVAWRCVEVVPCGFHIYQRQTVITPL